VGIILCVAEGTFLGSRFQVRDAARPAMTAPAVRLGMFPGQLESHFAVFEVGTVCIDPIVADQAVISVGLAMGLHKIRFDWLVAVDANGWVKFGVTNWVAGIAGEGGAICLAFVTNESIPERIMSNIGSGQVSLRRIGSNMIMVAELASHTGVILLENSV
jgi:hypothetical protein